MATVLAPPYTSPSLPDYLPARMVNEFVYCPRLFFYEWVEGVFRESADTIEGQAQHRRVDRETKGMPRAVDIADESIHTRSVTLSSEKLHIIAKLDLLEIEGGIVTPVDYKHGRPREKNDVLELWPTDRVQLTIQGLILRENGYSCNEGVVYYTSTKQRVRVPFGANEVAEAERAIFDAWQTARARVLPPPLVDSPKCIGCSLAPICLPDEVNRLGSEQM